MISKTPTQKIVQRKSKDTGKTVGIAEELTRKMPGTLTVKDFDRLRKWALSKKIEPVGGKYHVSSWNPTILTALKNPPKAFTYRQMVNLWKKAEAHNLGRPYTLVVLDANPITDAARKYAKRKKIRIFTNTQWHRKCGWMKEVMNA